MFNCLLCLRLEINVYPRLGVWFDVHRASATGVYGRYTVFTIYTSRGHFNHCAPLDTLCLPYTPAGVTSTTVPL